MMLKNFLFDLDGTLLPMDLKPFIELRHPAAHGLKTVY